MPTSRASSSPPSQLGFGARRAIRERSLTLGMSLAITALCTCAASCSEYHGARPVVMCGTTMSPGGLSAPLVLDEVPTDSPSRGSSQVTAYAGTLFLVSRGCGTGADVTFSRPDVTMGPVAYAKDGKPVIFAVSSANAPQTVAMTVTAHGHTRVAHVVVVGTSTAGDTQTTGFSSATRSP